MFLSFFIFVILLLSFTSFTVNHTVSLTRVLFFYSVARSIALVYSRALEERCVFVRALHPGYNVLPGTKWLFSPVLLRPFISSHPFSMPFVFLLSPSLFCWELWRRFSYFLARVATHCTSTTGERGNEWRMDGWYFLFFTILSRVPFLFLPCCSLSHLLYLCPL